MRVLVTHAVPVRYRAARSGADRHAFAPARTEVEIPEVDAAEFRDARSYVLATDRPEQRYSVCAGRCWHRLTERHLRFPPERSGYATPATLAAALRAPPPDGGELFRALTPLGHAPGLPDRLPDKLLARAGADHTEAARDALRAFASEHLAIGSDGSVWASRGMPVLAPLRAEPMLDRAPASLADGPVFERPRLLRLVTFCNGARMPNSAVKFVLPFERTFADVPYDGRDLELFLHDGPARIEHAQQLAARRTGIAAPAEAQVAAIRPYADLGMVGAVPAPERAHLLDLMQRALHAIRAACPDDYDPPQVRWMLAYADRVARLAHPQPAPPEDDLDSLSGLADGPGGRR